MSELSPQLRLAEIKVDWGVGLDWDAPTEMGMRSADVEWLCDQLEAAWASIEALQELSPPPGSELALMTGKADSLNVFVMQLEAACARKDEIIRKVFNWITSDVDRFGTQNTSDLIDEVGKR